MFQFSQSVIPWMLVLLLLAFILGFLILLVVDRRLSQIRITVPKPEVHIQWSKESFESQSEDNSSPKQDVPLSKEEELPSKKEEPITEKYEEPVKTTQDEKKKITVKPWTGNISLPNPPAIYGEDHYGPMNFPFPSEMTDEQRSMFVFGYPADMTTQDYINWLWLYRGQEGNLDLIHLQNLERLKSGRSLANIAPPAPRQAAPINPQDYFERQYPSLHQASQPLYGVASPPNQPTERIWAANTVEYADMAANWDVSTMRGEVWNPELSRKVDADELMRKLTPQIRTPPPPPNAPSPTDPSASPQDQHATIARTRGGNALLG